MESVDRWLAQQGIWDPGLTVEQCREQFVRFQGVSFGVAPPSEWPRLQRDLLQLEESFACRQSDIGLACGYAFDLELHDNTRICHRLHPCTP